MVTITVGSSENEGSSQRARPPWNVSHVSLAVKGDCIISFGPPCEMSSDHVSPWEGSVGCVTVEWDLGQEG